MPDQHEPIGRRARPADLGPVTETLALAFADDPLWSWAFDGVDEIRACWLPCVRSAIPHGWVWTTPGHEAATLWLPPGCPELSPEDDAAFEPALRALMGDRATLPLDAFAALDARHPAAPPHYYLSLFGTHPAHRGQGLATWLVATALTVSDPLAYSPAQSPNAAPATETPEEGDDAESTATPPDFPGRPDHMR